jgi:acetylornithine deacetylase/succinyl-diaminopimelate desuccinylase-like protein
MAKRLVDAGFDPADVQVMEPAPKKGNLVARLRGTGEARPILLMAHIDVVDAKKEDWSDGLDPFTLTERDGFFYGRGTLDDKGMASIFVANLARLKREGWKPKRDVIVALTADEEGGTHNGIQWLLAQHRPLIDAEFAINEGAEGYLVDGKPRLLGVQVSEKAYQSYEFEALNPGGHSSLPRPDNAIYELAAAMVRVKGYTFPARIGPVIRQYAATIASTVTGPMRASLEALAAGAPSEDDLRRVSADPEVNARLRTTCVATRIDGGHADNALPGRARATVNCRLLPEEREDFVAAELKRLAGDKVGVTPKNPLRVSEATSVEAAPMRAIERVARGIWPEATTYPVMSVGGTDGSRLRNIGIPVYGVLGIFVPYGESRMHGRDERIPVRSYFDGLEFHYRLLHALAD